MKKTITLFRFLLLAGMLFGLSGQTNAQTNSAMASDLTYINVAPNVYLVNLKLYRDCTGADPGPTQILTYRAPGCDSTIRTTTLNLQGAPVTANPYCKNPGPCTGDSTGLINYQEHNYQVAVTLPTQCSNWLLSVWITNRPYSRNLANGRSEFLYTEALINNLATQTNNSPVFGNAGVALFEVDRQVTFNPNVTDADGDSIVYSLVPALSDFNTPVVYGNFTGSGTGTNPYPAGPSPAGTNYPSGNFSASNPLIAKNPIYLDRLTGAMIFEPLGVRGSFFPAYQGLDKHVVAIQVDEYRKINGVVTKIGHVRRDMMFVVIMQILQDRVLFSSAGQPVKAVYEIPAMVNTCLIFNGFNLTAGSTLVMTSDASQISPAATFTVAGSSTSKTGTFCWRPTSADIRSTPYRLTITVREDNCPASVTSTYPINIRVVKHKLSDPGPVVATNPNQPGVSRQAIPNIITPNGDGLNDAFVIPDLPENAELQVFDRKHRLIRTFKSYRNNWQAEGMKDGVYFYILKDKETGEVRKGQVTVVR